MRTSPRSLVLAPAAALALALGVTPAPALAQKMYRCGKTFSQVPCASDAKEVVVRSDNPSAPAPGPRGADLCRQEAPKLLRLPDPNSTRFTSVTKREAQAIQEGGVPMFARRYEVVLNAMNQQGAYQGDTPYMCYLNETETRVIRIEPLNAP